MASLHVTMSSIAVIALACSASGAFACDELASRLFAKALRPAVESLECSVLGKAGLDKAEHRLERVCYSSSGPESEIEIAANLKCRTGDGAFLKAQLSERVTARARVRGADCQIVHAGVDAAGEIGKLLIQAFDANGKVRRALEDALRQSC